MTGARIDERIGERYANLSPQERKAADTLLAHLGDLATYNAAELADLAGVSKATMSRLFRHLGFSDFGEAREHVRSLRGQGVPISLDPQASLADHVAQELDNLHRALAAAGDGTLERAVELLADSRRVVVVGQRNSYPVALHLRQQLAQARADVVVAPQPGQKLADEVVGLGADDLVVLVAFRRRATGVRALVDALQAAGVPVLMLADTTARPYAPQVEVWLEVPVATRLAFDSYAAAATLVSVLADRVLARLDGSGQSRVREIVTAYEALGEIDGL